VLRPQLPVRQTLEHRTPDRSPTDRCSHCCRESPMLTKPRVFCGGRQCKNARCLLGVEPRSISRAVLQSHLLREREDTTNREQRDAASAERRGTTDRWIFCRNTPVQGYGLRSSRPDTDRRCRTATESTVPESDGDGDVRATLLPGVAWRPICSARYSAAELAGVWSLPPMAGVRMVFVRAADGWRPIAESANPGATPPAGGHRGQVPSLGWSVGRNRRVFEAAVHERPLVDSQWARDSLSSVAAGFGSWQPMGVRSGQNGVRALRFGGRNGVFSPTPCPTAGDVR
jgi:hypothetical protein